MWTHSKRELNAKFTVFICIYSLLIEKEFCECRNCQLSLHLFIWAFNPKVCSFFSVRVPSFYSCCGVIRISGLSTWSHTGTFIRLCFRIIATFNVVLLNIEARQVGMYFIVHFYAWIQGRGAIYCSDCTTWVRFAAWEFHNGRSMKI